MNIVELLIVGATIDLINKSPRIEYEGTSIFIDDTALSRNQLKILDSAYGLIFDVDVCNNTNYGDEIARLLPIN